MERKAGGAEGKGYGGRERVGWGREDVVGDGEREGGQGRERGQVGRRERGQGREKGQVGRRERGQGREKGQVGRRERGLGRERGCGGERERGWEGGLGKGMGSGKGGEVIGKRDHFPFHCTCGGGGGGEGGRHNRERLMDEGGWGTETARDIQTHPNMTHPRKQTNKTKTITFDLSVVLLADVKVTRTTDYHR